MSLSELDNLVRIGKLKEEALSRIGFGDSSMANACQMS